MPEYQGDEDFIVIKKCEAAHDHLHRSVLVEDTSLAIDCLGGLPGPYVSFGFTIITQSEKKLSVLLLNDI